MPTKKTDAESKTPQKTSSTVTTPKENKKVPPKAAETKQTEKPAATKPKQATAEKKKTEKPASVAEKKETATPVPATEKKKTEKPAPAAKKQDEKPVTSAEKREEGKPAPAAKEKSAAKAKKREEAPIAAASVPDRTERENEQTEDIPRGENKRGGFGGLVAAVKEDKIRTIVIAAASFLLIFTIVLGIVLGIHSCSVSYGPVRVAEALRYDIGEHKSTTQVGYYGTALGKTERVKPVQGEPKDEGLASGYPTYGYTLRDVIGTEDDKVAARDALINESSYLTATGTRNAGGGNYIWMDKDGKLYNGTTAEPDPSIDRKSGLQRQLYQHTASVGLYGGNVSDDEPGIVKQVTLRPRGYSSYSVTGVYAPAGEVIKIEISEADMNATGGITIHIGQALYNGQANNIWTAKNQMQRIPHLLNTMTVNKNTATLENGVYTAYVGSFIGGPLYIRNTLAPFTATISGGVAYPHFILGYTTEKEFEENKKSSAPYFDLEVWSYGVLHSGPRQYAENFSYDDLYKAAVLWEKVSSVTTTGSNQGIVFLYDPFVAAGAAVAFPGRSSVNCPAGWMSSSLNYNAIVTSGSWGNFHEYHHNFQGYGVGNGGEVTNNGMTLVSYALFTKISANRSLSNNGAGSLGGWNAYTSATWALEDLKKIARGESPSNGKQGLAIYASLLHNFGPDNYIQAKIRQQSKGYGQSYEGYLKAWQDVTHNDMTYFFKDVLQGIDANKANELKNPEYSMFVPVSSVYQTGRSYLYDGEKRYFDTMRPYAIPYGDEFTFDLREYSAPGGQYASGSIVLPEGFSYKIKNVSQPENGKITKSPTEGMYNYIPDPDSESLRSGKILVTLEITKDDGAFEVDDVDLVLEFEQSHELNKTVLERTTYTFNESEMYADAQAAFEDGFKKAVSHETYDHTNPTQNCNTDIWYYPDTEQNRKDHPTSPEYHFIHDNRIDVLDGKLYFEEDGKYRIYLRGRFKAAMYYSLDGKDYTLGGKINDTSTSADFRLNDENTYFDIEFNKNEVYVDDVLVMNEFSGTRWVYVKEILIQESSPRASYIGLGVGTWQEPQYTMVEKYYDKNGKEVASPEAEGYDHSLTFYYDNAGLTVDPEVVAAAKKIAPKSASYVNAYRSSYEFPDNKGFVSDYFYTRSYNYNYTDNLWQNESGQTIVSTNYAQGNSWNWNLYQPENLTDGNRTTFIHTKNGVGASPDKPLEFIVDMGAEKSVNRMTIYTQYRPNGDWHAPKDFTLQGSLDGTTFFPVGTFTDVPHSGTVITVDFDETTFRYYKLVITGSHSSLMIIGEIEMWRAFEVNGGKHHSLDEDMFECVGSWTGAQVSSTFGHVYVGGKNSTVTFEFEGTRLGILTSKAFGTEFEVKIDGKVVTSFPVKDDSSPVAMSFLSERLERGKHKVVITCLKEANLDSIVLFDEE